MRPSNRWVWPANSPDIIIGCTGGGSNFAGLTFPFLWWAQLPRWCDPPCHRRRAGMAPSPTRGVYAYDFGDTGKMTPLVKMHTSFRLRPRADPRGRAALSRHGAAGRLLKEHDFIEARSVHQRSSFEAGVTFARAEGILPAPGTEFTPSGSRSTRHGRPRRRAKRGSSCSTCAATVTSTCRGLRALPRWHAFEDYEYPVEKVEAALHCATGRRLIEIDRRRESAARVPWTSDRAHRTERMVMPRPACQKCGCQLYTVSPLESLFAEERRCLRCGAFLNIERRDHDRRYMHRRQNPQSMIRERPAPASGGRGRTRRPPAGGGHALATLTIGPAERWHGERP